MFVLTIFRPVKVTDGAAFIHFYRDHGPFLNGFCFDFPPPERWMPPLWLMKFP
jgi:hypothetical protein